MGSEVAERVATLPAPMPQRGALTAADIRDHVNRIQEVMQAVMKPDVHYGKIPGTPKPTLYKQGAEVLSVTFRIAPSYKTDDLSTEDVVRYRITCVGTHQVSGQVLGEGVGECSSNEEKYRWRRPVSDAEFNAAPENRKRLKFTRDGQMRQIRTEPADVANTILKMGAKRAYVAMILSVTGASDIFAQDIEDLPEHLREEEAPKGAPAKPPYSDDAFAKNLPAWGQLVASGKKTPQAIAAALESKATLTEKQRKKILALTQPASTEEGFDENA